MNESTCIMDNRFNGDDNGYRSTVTYGLIVIIILFHLAHKLADTAMSQ